MKGTIGLIVALAIAVGGFMWYRSNEAEKDRKAKIEAAEAAARAKVEAEAKAKQEAEERAAKEKALAESKAKHEKQMADIQAKREKQMAERKEAGKVASLERKLENLKSTLKRDKARLDVQYSELKQLEAKLKNPGNHVSVSSASDSEVKKYAAEIEYYKSQDEKIRMKMYSNKDDRKTDLFRNKRKYDDAVEKYNQALSSYNGNKKYNDRKIKAYTSQYQSIYDRKLMDYKLAISRYNTKRAEYKALKKQLKKLDSDDDVDKEPAAIAAN